MIEVLQITKVDVSTPPAYIKTMDRRKLEDGDITSLQEVTQRTRIIWSAFYVKLNTSPDRMLYDRSYQKEEIDGGRIVLALPQPNLLGAFYPYTMKDKPSIYISFPVERETIIDLDQDLSIVSRNIITGFPLYLPELGLGMFFGFNLYPESLVMYSTTLQRAVVLKHWTNYFDRITMLELGNKYFYMRSGNINFVIDPSNLSMYMVSKN